MKVPDNCTVEQLIELLQQCDKDAVVCITEIDGDEIVEHSSLEIMFEDKRHYVNSSGLMEYGKIISLY